MLTLFSTFRKQQSGFTLVEIAVVLVIVGLLVGSFIGTFAGRIDTTRRDNTKKELLEIKQVLMAYAFTKLPPRLPCPDTSSPPDGLQDVVGDGSGSFTCAPYDVLNPLGLDQGVQQGVLPWRDLGLGREDSWATHYSYWVNRRYASEAGFNMSSSDIGAGNAAIETRVADLDKNMVTNAVAVFFSHGKNGLGGIGSNGVDRDIVPASHVDELMNVNVGQIYMSRRPSEEGSASAGGVFDDILVWINSYELKAKMVDVGVLPL